MRARYALSSRLFTALCSLLTAFYLAPMSYFKSILLVFSITILALGCKSKTENTPVSSTPEVKTDSISAASNNDAIPGTILSSRDMGKSWQPDTNGLPIQLKPSGLDQLGSELVMATVENGLFMTENDGSHWKDISNGLATKKINTLFVSGNELYLGLFHEGVTMWKLNSSYWNSYNLNLPNRNVTAITKVKNELLVGTDMGIFKSSGNVKTWTGKVVGEKVTSLLAKGDTIFAGTLKGVMISKDGGEKWTYTRKSGQVYALTLIDRFLYAQFTSGELYRLDTKGNKWINIEYSEKTNTPVYCIVKVNDHYLFSTRAGIFASPNGENEWSLIYHTQSYWFADMVMKDQILYGAIRSDRH